MSNPTSQEPSPNADRRQEVDVKQAFVAQLLQETGCEGLLVVHPDHFSWLTAGGSAPCGVLDADAMPALYFTAESRWLLCSNVDTQRLFDEEIDSLGFQLKEWPWHLGRETFLENLCDGKVVCCDVPFGQYPVVGDRLKIARRVHTEYERACLRTVGQIVSHALEATGRTLMPGETEREIAGQVSHRLLHRGAQPVMIAVSAEGRLRVYRQGSYTSVPVKNYCVLTCVARKYGVCVEASRAIHFGQPDPQIRKEHDAACKVSATYMAATWPDAIPRLVLAGGKRIYEFVGVEHEFYQSPQGKLIGRDPVESLITPRTEELFQAHQAVVWNALVGAAASCDTFLISEEGAKVVTPSEAWPLKRIRIQGQDYVRPDILVR